MNRVKLSVRPASGIKKKKKMRGSEVKVVVSSKGAGIVHGIRHPKQRLGRLPRWQTVGVDFHCPTDRPHTVLH